MSRQSQNHIRIARKMYAYVGGLVERSGRDASRDGAGAAAGDLDVDALIGLLALPATREAVTRCYSPKGSSGHRYCCRHRGER